MYIEDDGTQSIGMNAVSPKQTHMQEAIIYVRDRYDRLHLQIEQLEKHLNVVMRPEEPSPEEPKLDRRGGSILANDVYEIGEWLDKSADTISNYISRLDT